MNQELANLFTHKDFSVKYHVPLGDKSIDIPVVYPDTGAVMAFFPIAIAKAHEYIKTKRFKPVSILGGKSLAGITVFDYRDSPVGPYREMALSIPVTLDSIISIPFLPLFFD